MAVAEEARLLALAREGDMRAFGRLVDAHQPAVRAFLRRLVGNDADADDVAQDAFARTWEVLHRFDGRSAFRTFVCGVAYQYWRRGRRAETRRLARDGAYAQLEDEFTVAPDSTPERLALRRAMDALPADQRAVLALCLGQEFTHQEAAEALNLPLGTVKSHIARGRARLHAALGLAETNDAR
jgi:RNA polymerase sigma-70 factor (ECF subfamily)